MSIQTQKSTGQGQLFFSRIALIIGTLTVVASWYVFSGVGSYEALLLPGLFSLATVGGVVGFSRVRARARWEAAWDAYAAQDGSRDTIRPYQEEGILSMAGTR